MHVRLHIPMYSAPARDMGLPGLVAYHVMCVCGLSFFFLSFFFSSRCSLPSRPCHSPSCPLLVLDPLPPSDPLCSTFQWSQTSIPSPPFTHSKTLSLQQQQSSAQSQSGCLRSTYLSCLCIPSWTCFGHRSCWRRSSKLDPHLVTYSFRLPRNPPPY